MNNALTHSLLRLAEQLLKRSSHSAINSIGRDLYDTVVKETQNIHIKYIDHIARQEGSDRLTSVRTMLSHFEESLKKEQENA